MRVAMYLLFIRAPCKYSLGDQVLEFPLSEHSRFTSQETASIALRFCFLWFVANWTVNAALAYTSVSSATVLSSMSGE